MSLRVASRSISFLETEAQEYDASRSADRRDQHVKAVSYTGAQQLSSMKDPTVSGFLRQCDVPDGAALLEHTSAAHGSGLHLSGGPHSASQEPANSVIAATGRMTIAEIEGWAARVDARTMCSENDEDKAKEKNDKKDNRPKKNSQGT